MKLTSFATIACLVVVTGTARAQFTAHCHCKIAPDQGPNSVSQVNPGPVDLGDIKEYSGVNPQSPGNLKNPLKKP